MLEMATPISLVPVSIVLLVTVVNNYPESREEGGRRMMHRIVSPLF